MALTKRVIPVAQELVFAVLSDPPSYDAFVVGTKAIRRFDPRYPEPGTAFAHTLGFGPLFLRDETRVERVEPPARLVLRAFMRPVGVTRVDFRLAPSGGGTLVTVEEYPIDGPLSRVWSPPLEVAMWLRNLVTLVRLQRLARRRAEQVELEFSRHRA